MPDRQASRSNAMKRAALSSRPRNPSSLWRSLCCPLPMEVSLWSSSTHRAAISESKSKAGVAAHIRYCQLRRAREGELVMRSKLASRATVLAGLLLAGPAIAGEWLFSSGDESGTAYIQGESGLYALLCYPGDNHWTALLAVPLSETSETIADEAETTTIMLQTDALAYGLLAEAVISTQQPDAIGFVAGVAQSWVDEILQSEESFIVGIAKDE